MKTITAALVILALNGGCTDSQVRQKLAALQPQYTGSSAIAEPDSSADVIALVTVLNTESSVRAKDGSQGWACSRFKVNELLKGEIDAGELDVVCAHALTYPDVELGTYSDRRAKNAVVDAVEGDRLLVFMKISDSLSRSTAQTVYHASVIYRMKTEPNKAMEPTPVNVTVPAGAGPAPFTCVAHLGR